MYEHGERRRPPSGRGSWGMRGIGGPRNLLLQPLVNFDFAVAVVGVVAVAGSEEPEAVMTEGGVNVTVLSPQLRRAAPDDE